MSLHPENMYEIPKNPADKEDVKKLERKLFIVSIGFIFLALIALVAVGIAVYAVAKDSDSSNGKSIICFSLV